MMQHSSCLSLLKHSYFDVIELVFSDQKRLDLFFHFLSTLWQEALFMIILYLFIFFIFILHSGNLFRSVVLKYINMWCLKFMLSRILDAWLLALIVMLSRFNWLWLTCLTDHRILFSTQSLVLLHTLMTPQFVLLPSTIRKYFLQVIHQVFV